MWKQCNGDGQCCTAEAISERRHRALFASGCRRRVINSRGATYRLGQPIFSGACIGVTTTADQASRRGRHQSDYVDSANQPATRSRRVTQAARRSHTHTPYMPHTQASTPTSPSLYLNAADVSNAAYADADESASGAASLRRRVRACMFSIRKSTGRATRSDLWRVRPDPRSFQRPWQSPLTSGCDFIVDHASRNGRSSAAPRVAYRALQVDSRRSGGRAAAVIRPGLERRLSMFRVPMFALLLLAGLAGCADDSSGHHKGPPQDPADYHGVPTDTRPPSMVPTPTPP